MTTASYIRTQYVMLVGAGFFISVLDLCHVTLSLAVSSRPQTFFLFQWNLVCT